MEQTNTVQDVRKAVAENKAIVGTKRTIKALQTNTAAKVYITKNAPADVKETIGYYVQLNSIEVIDLDQTNEELGTLCKKPFVISVVAVAK